MVRGITTFSTLIRILSHIFLLRDCRDDLLLIPSRVLLLQACPERWQGIEKISPSHAPLLEGGRVVGGRTSLWGEGGMLVESGLHRVLGFYTAFPDLLRKAGLNVDDLVCWEDEIEIRLPGCRAPRPARAGAYRGVSGRQAPGRLLLAGAGQ